MRFNMVSDGIVKLFSEALSRARAFIVNANAYANGRLVHSEEAGGAEYQWRPVSAVEMLMQWENMMVTFCMGTAIAIATVSVQIQTKLSPMFQFLSGALMGCFCFTTSAKLIKLQRVSQILYFLGGFCFVTAFFIAIAIPYAFHFQILTLALYLVFLFIAAFSLLIG